MRLIPVLTALLVAVGFYFWIVEGNSDAASPDAPAAAAEPVAAETPVAVVAIRSRAERVENAIVLRGRTEAFRKVDVMAQVEGLVISEPLRAGAMIRQGDELCRLDPSDRLVALEEAQAWLEEARIRERAASELMKRGYTAENTAMNTQAALRTAVTRVERAELDIARMTIKAPFDGLLETDTAEIGSLLRSGSLCATIIALDPIKFVGFVPERDVSRLETGAPARARLLDGREVTGTVGFVSRSADEITRTYRAEVKVPNPDHTLRDGQTAEIVIPLAGEVAHWLPQSALTLDDDGRLGVRIVAGDAAKFVPVAVLRDDEGGVWLSGLPDEADVIVVGQEFISDGRRIAVTMTDRDALE
ncbi:MAG TPA: efflux RND transporter periplasmic adaptor subunit [Paracoccaceae bacterium]|nr:efflux RND transporter periplasmic adaptor subunit [Paracoccaceae bacterium]